MAAYTTINDIPLALESSVRRTMRRQVIQFGDGYSQILTDGLNSQQEVWTLKTNYLTESEASGIEAFFWRTRGQAFSWYAPGSSKTFEAQFSAGSLTLGWTRLESLTLTGYTKPTNYTANMTSGVLTSVTIADGVDVSVALTLAPRTYVLEDGWQRSYISCSYHELTFNLREVYV